MKTAPSYVPRPYQSKAIADLRASVASGHRSPVLVMPTGCHAAGTEILMFDGSLRPVESIHVGDLVMGPDSQPRLVLELHRGEDEMFRVTPIKGDPFVVNGDHVLSLRTSNDGGKWAGMVRNVTVREWLSASQTFRHVNKLYRVAVEFQAGEMLRVHPYLLGALIGDGCLGYGAALIANPDAEIKAEVTAIAAGCGLTVSDHKADGRCPQYALVTPRGKPNPLRQAIRGMGLRCRSSHKFIPAEYKVASRQDRLEILAGLLDTDGHLGHNTYDFVSASEALARDTAFVARSLGLAAYVKPCRKAWQNGVGDYWRVCISGDTDIIPCRVVRKQAKKRKQIKSALVTGFKVESIGAGEYFGFECDGDHLYLMGDFTVTHNSGKTICAANLILGAVNKGRKVLFLSPRRELVFQTSEKLTALDVQHGIIMAGERPSMMPDVQIASVPTMFARYFRDHDDGAFARDLPRADLIVIDELHACMSSMTTRILAAYPNAVRIGLTATPARSDGRGLGEICDDMVFGPSVADLTQMGMLVPLRYFGAEKADLSAVRIQAGDYHQTDLGEAMNKPKLVGDVVQNWLRLCPDRLTVVFAVNRAHAKALQDEFTHAGVSAGYIDGETPNDERHEIFAAMVAGDMRVLCSVDVVSMGWDMPQASCGIIARPTKSVARYLQMVGRIMRIHPLKSDAWVIDHAGAVDELGFADDPQPWSLDGKSKIQDRKAAAEKKEPKPIECRQCRRVFKPAKRCPGCGHDMSGLASKAIAAHQAELQEIDRKTRTAVAKTYTMADKQQWWSGFLHLARERGKSSKWVLAQYKSKFGVWPRGLVDTPIPPLPEVASWEHSQRIRYAKGAR